MILRRNETTTQIAIPSATPAPQSVEPDPVLAEGLDGKSDSKEECQNEETIDVLGTGKLFNEPELQSPLDEPVVAAEPKMESIPQQDDVAGAEATGATSEEWVCIVSVYQYLGRSTRGDSVMKRN